MSHRELNHLVSPHICQHESGRELRVVHQCSVIGSSVIKPDQIEQFRICRSNFWLAAPEMLHNNPTLSFTTAPCGFRQRRQGTYDNCSTNLFEHQGIHATWLPGSVGRGGRCCVCRTWRQPAGPAAPPSSHPHNAQAHTRSRTAAKGPMRRQP